MISMHIPVYVIIRVSHEKHEAVHHELCIHTFVIASHYSQAHTSGLLALLSQTCQDGHAPYNTSLKYKEIYLEDVL